MMHWEIGPQKGAQQRRGILLIFYLNMIYYNFAACLWNKKF